MSQDNNNNSNKAAEQQYQSATQQNKTDEKFQTTKKLESLQSMKMGDILSFDNENEIDVEGSDMKMKKLFEEKKKEKDELESLKDKLMRETISLGLHKKKMPSKSLSSLDNSTSTSSGNSDTINSQTLSSKLEKKWGLNQINETDDEKAFMKDLLNSNPASQPPKIENKQNLPLSEEAAREKFIAQHLYQPSKRKNITEYNSRYSHEIDPMMQGSHLDIKNEDTPKMMRYMDEFREFKPQINIGERWGQIIQSSAINRIQYEQQIAKGGNLLSYMAKTGKLGVDLYFIVFGITAVFFIPYMIYQHQKQKINYIQKTKNINPKTVPDFYNSEYDLDEISVQKSFYNQYTSEIMEEKNKKLKLHKEIQSLTSMLYSNK